MGKCANVSQSPGVDGPWQVTWQSNPGEGETQLQILPSDTC